MLPIFIWDPSIKRYTTGKWVSVCVCTWVKLCYVLLIYHRDMVRHRRIALYFIMLSISIVCVVLLCWIFLNCGMVWGLKTYDSLDAPLLLLCGRYSTCLCPYSMSPKGGDHFLFFSLVDPPSLFTGLWSFCTRGTLCFLSPTSTRW